MKEIFKDIAAGIVFMAILIGGIFLIATVPIKYSLAFADAIRVPVTVTVVTMAAALYLWLIGSLVRSMIRGNND